MVLQNRNYVEFKEDRPPPEPVRMLNPVAVGNLLAKRAENMKMGQQQLEKGKKDDEETLEGGHLPHWWRSGITGRKRARLEEEEEPEIRPLRRKRRKQCDV